MKKRLNIALAVYTTLIALSNLNAAKEADAVNPDLVRGCHSVREEERIFCCPLELPGFYTVNPARLEAFLDAVPKAKEFFDKQAEIAIAAKLSDVDRENLTKFQTAQFIAQAYFRTTGEEHYIAKLPFVDGREDEILEIAQRTDLLNIQSPLAEYVQYRHLSKVIGDKRVLVLGCGNASLNTTLYEVGERPLLGVPQYYMHDHTGFVSSGCHCDHAGHITVSRSPGIFPSIVADIFNPDFQAGLKATADAMGGFQTIVDESVLSMMQHEQDKKSFDTQMAFFKSLLAPGGKIIILDYSEPTADGRPGWKYL